MRTALGLIVGGALGAFVVAVLIYRRRRPGAPWI
jgi:hypothetical protein